MEPSGRKLKIVYLVLKGMPSGGGIEKYTEEIGSRLVERGHEVLVYTMRHYGAVDGIYRGMKIRTVPTIKTKSLEKLVASLSASVVQMFEPGVDIVHMHAFGPSMFAFIPRLMGRKILTQGHGLEWKRSKWGVVGRGFLKITECPSVLLPHALTVVSNVQKKYLIRRYGRDSSYIPTGVNPPIIQSPEIIHSEYGLNGNDYILFAARLVREKGAHYLIEAFRKSNTGLKLVIAGDAQHEDAYKKELRELAKGDENIIFTGFVAGKPLYELFSNAYLFVLPSEIEGLPTALLEAMSYGNCTLVSDIPENLEALNGLGYTFRNKDTDDLARMLEYLANNRELLTSYSAQAKEHVLKNHSWDTIAVDFEKLYLGLVK